MSSGECSSCGQPVLAEFDVCPNCGWDLGSTENGEPAPEPTGSRPPAGGPSEAATPPGPGGPEATDTDPERPGAAETGPGEPGQQPGTAASSQPDYTGWPQGRKTTVFGAVAAAVGAFLPWFTAGVAEASASVPGTDAGGWVTLGAAGLLLAVSVWHWGPAQRGVCALVGLAVFGAAMFYIGVPSAGAEGLLGVQQLQGDPAPGLGLYATAFGGLAAVMSAISDTWFDTDWKRP
jgi:hypothetical protein